MASAPQKKWHKLDNTANLFPVIASRRAANVFRMAAVLHDAVDPALLQKALEDTLPYFAAFAVRLRHGLFWSYLEQNDAPVRVQPEPVSYTHLDVYKRQVLPVLLKYTIE